MSSKNKSPSVYGKAVLKETRAQLKGWNEAIEKLIFISDEIGARNGNVLLEIALEKEMSDFIFDLEESAEKALEGDSALLLEALSKRIEDKACALASELGFAQEEPSDALIFLSSKGKLSEMKEYLEEIEKDFGYFLEV